MAVTEVLNALGSFDLELSTTTPRDLLDRIEHFGHIAIVSGRVNPAEYEDNLLDVARYVGVVRRKRISDSGTDEALEDNVQISGCGMAFWLGDEDGKGDVIETTVELNQSIFPTAVETLLPDAVVAGDISDAVGNTFTGETATGVSTSLTADYIVVSDADAADITIGDDVLLYNSSGDLKEGTIFTVTGKPSAFGFTNIEFSPDAAGVTVSGDQVRVGSFGTFSGAFIYQTPRDAVHYLCQTMSSSSAPVTWRVNGDATIDAGLHSELFVTDPTCTVVRKGVTPGNDMGMRALSGSVEYQEDMEDFTTRVVMLAQGSGEDIATGSADIAGALNTFKDLHGNALKLTRLVSESSTIEENADTRAAIALTQYSSSHKEFTVSADDYDIDGTFRIGDYVYLYDPDSGLVDEANEIIFRGVRLNPIKQQVSEAVWNITEGFTVAYRDAEGDWFDLTDNVVWETLSSSRLVVGDPTKQLIPGTESSVGIRTGIIVDPVDTTIPSAPTWVTASFQTVNYADSQGNPKARQKLVWTVPTNTDLTVITDGSHYEIQYKLDTGSQYSQTWAAASTLTWDEANTWEQPVEPDDVQWQTVIVPWGETTTVIHDLPVGTGFDSRIRAVDTASNQGDWSTTETWITSEDNIPPSPPAPPVVAGSAIAIQVIHELGMASGGTFNLENDLAYLEVHYSADNGFFPDANTLAGRLRANRGMMAAGTAAVGTFTVPETSAVFVKVVAVDLGGNRSSASDAAEVTADLINSQHISELTASKITAGTLGANIILGASIQTAEDGQRIALNQDGLQTYDADGDLSTNISANPTATGDFMSFRDADGNTVATIAENGDSAFTNVYANEAVYVAGESVQDKIDRLPRGILALTLAPTNGVVTTGADSAGGAVWNRIVVTDFDSTRQYRISYAMRIDVGATTPAYVGCNTYFKWDGEATNLDNDGVLFDHQYGGRGSSATDLAFSGTHTFNQSAPSGTELHLGFYVVANIAGVKYQGTSWGRVWLEDMGPALPYDTFDPTSGGGGADGGDTPVQQYTTSYSSAWTRSYQGDGDLRISNGDMYQGHYSSTQGNQRSLIGFDYSSIQDDLAGSTVEKVQLTLDNNHFYFNSGGTAVIGLHNYGSAPGSWSGGSVDESIQNFTWAKGAKKTVTLLDSFGEELRDGTAKGIALGPGDSDSNTYYGIFAGQNSSNKPVLKITYTK